MKGVVIACAGPSLCRVDPWSAGWDVCAVSTAIKVITRPTWWFSLDGCSGPHMPEGQQALDAGVPIIIPNYKGVQRGLNHPNVVQVQINYAKGAKQDQGREAFDGKLPYMRAAHYSVLAAVQWLVHTGHDLLIFAGCELKVVSSGPNYAYSASRQHQYAHLRRCMTSVYDVMKVWSPIAVKKGLLFVDWSEGRLSEFMPKYEESKHAAQKTVANEAHTPDGQGTGGKDPQQGEAGDRRGAEEVQSSRHAVGN